MSPLPSSDKTNSAIAATAALAPEGTAVVMARAISVSRAAPPLREKAVAADDPATLASRLASRANQLDFLRLWAALLVIVSHYYALRDGDNRREPYERLSGYCNLGKLAVYSFFFISGLLAARSFLTRPDPGRYLWNRARRIFPALGASVAFCILLVGPLLTTLPLRTYLTHPATLQFAGNAALLPNHYDLPGVFAQYPHGDPRAAVNGSLWSVPCGMLMFFAIAALGTLRLLGRKPLVAAITLAMLLAWLTYHFGLITAAALQRHKIWVEFLPHLGFFFFAGVLAYLYRDRIRPDGRLCLLCLLAIAATWRTTWPGGGRGGYVVFTLCLPYVLLYLSFARWPLLSPALQRINCLGDFSYGVYLFGYPVQQLLMGLYGPRLSAAGHILLACLASLVLAALSWHLIERPILRGRLSSPR
jgi:peptidoglycan/LPS O-acetylase OafA/YrhL